MFGDNVWSRRIVFGKPGGIIFGPTIGRYTVFDDDGNVQYPTSEIWYGAGRGDVDEHLDWFKYLFVSISYEQKDAFSEKTFDGQIFPDPEAAIKLKSTG